LSIILRPVALCNRVFLRFSQKFFEKSTDISGISKMPGVEGLRKGKSSPAFAVAKGGEYHE
jgi:hypothetical protein